MTDRPQNNESSPLETTVQPVRRPVAASSTSTVEQHSRSAWSGPVVIAAAATVCLLGLLLVFFYLPARVAEDRQQDTVAVTDVADELPAMPQLSAEQIAALTAQAESLLAQLLEQQQLLESRSVRSWGDTPFSAYQSASRLADDAFLAGDLDAAVGQYTEALRIGSELLSRSDQIVGDAIAAGNAAIDGGDAELAASQFTVALDVDPDNAQARRGLARANVLTEVLREMDDGARQAELGNYSAAIDAFRRALAVDSDYQPARAALRLAESSAEDAEFEQLLAAGFDALDSQAFERAIEQFQAALVMRPANEAATNGMNQAIEGQELNAITMAEIRGRAFERREAWEQAIERYREALATDASLKFAIDGLARAQQRADLDTKLEALIASPRMLLTDEVLNDARGLLAEAAAIDSPGPRLSSQVEQLDRLVVLASTPIQVTLVSDSMTEVAVFRVGDLGTFQSTELQLRPGTYTATGRRRGFRDVRETFTVLPGTDNGPVTVICVEPIDARG